MAQFFPSMFGGFSGGGGAPVGPATTWNSADKGTDIVLSGGDLTASNATGNWNQVRSTTSRTDKRYFEATFPVNTGSWGVGFGNSTLGMNGFEVFGNNLIVAFSDKNVYYGGGSASALGVNNPATVIGCSVDVAAGTAKFRRAEGGAFVEFTADISIPLLGTPLFAVLTLQSGPSVTANFGATAFHEAPPAGYVAWDA